MQSFTIICLIVAAMVAMAVIGWISFATFEDGASVTINTKEMKEDVSEIAEKGEELIDKATVSSQKILEQSEESKTPQTKSEVEKQESVPQ